MTGQRITTAGELDMLLAAGGEMAEPLVVREGGFRVWILTEDDDGRWWAWSWREEGEQGYARLAHSLRLPLTVLYRPDAATEPPSTLQGSGDTATQMAPSDDSAVERADHRCDSGWFDRTLCACGAMHSYCTTCGKRADDCDLELPQALAAARAGEAERHPSHYSTPGGHSGRREDCKVCPPAGEDCGHPNHDADKHDCRPFRAGEPERLSQLHADALATLDAVADRMDEHAYDELRSALEDGVLSDEDGRAMHTGRVRGGESVDREALAEVIHDAIDEDLSSDPTRAELQRACQRAADAVLAMRPGATRGGDALDWLVSIGVCQGGEEDSDLHARYCAPVAAALATRGDTTVRVSAERVQSAILTARWPDGSLIDSVTPRSTAIIAEFVMKAVTP